MAYLDSMHFSDKLSYRKHFIPNYGVKDINFASFKHLQQIFRKTDKTARGFSHRRKLARLADRRAREVDGVLTGRR
jgi:hypothetical protein